MRCARLALAAVVAAAVSVLSAPAAHGSLTSECEAQGTVAGHTYNPKTVDKVTLPRSGEVRYTASVPGTGERVVSGKVAAKLPPPIGSVTLGDWSDESDDHEKTDVYEYDLPSVLAGVEIPVTGSHSEPNVTCAGAVVVVIDGSDGIGNPAVIGSFVVLVLSGIGLFVAMKPKAV